MPAQGRGIRVWGRVGVRLDTGRATGRGQQRAEGFVIEDEVGGGGGRVRGEEQLRGGTGAGWSSSMGKWRAGCHGGVPQGMEARHINWLSAYRLQLWQRVV